MSRTKRREKYWRKVRNHKAKLAAAEKVLKDLINPPEPEPYILPDPHDPPDLHLKVGSSKAMMWDNDSQAWAFATQSTKMPWS